MTFRRPVSALLLTVMAVAAPTASQRGSDAHRLPYPPAARGSDADVLHGVTVADPYRWLEELSAERTREWIKAQDDLTRRELDGEAYRRYRARLQRLAGVRRYTTPVRRGNRWFFFETDSNGQSGRVLMMKDSADAAPRPLVDHRARGTDALSALLSPAPDGRLVAYGETVGGRWLRLMLIEPATGKTAGDVLENLHGSMGSIAWVPDASAFYYVRLDPPLGSRLTAPVTGAVVMRHVLGTPQSADEPVFQQGGNRFYTTSVTDDGRWLVVTSSTGAASDVQVFVRDQRGTGSRFVELFAGTPGRFTFLGGKEDHLWFQTSADAPRGRIVRVAVRRPDPSQWSTVVPEPDEAESLVYANLVADRLIVMSTRDAAPRVRIHALAGKLEREVPLPALGTVWGRSGGGLGFVGRSTDSEAYFTVSGIADPGSIYRLDPRTGRTSLFMRPSYGFEPGDFIGRQVFYPAKDGTRIPMFIAHHRSVRPDGARAVFMYGYGAGGWSAFPWFQPHVLAWMESGGVYAMPSLRGGGEYGERWHAAAVREKKQVSVDDYISAAEWLLANKYAAPGKVVANGGSISGVIAAAAIVQRPTLFGAAVIDIPALDMIRYDRHTGAAAWIPEFGSTASAAEFRALRALSPYHNLDPAVCYPPTLVLAGEKDDVAVPSHAYKFVAALQHTQRCGNPVFLQVAWGAGHTFGTSNETSGENWARQLAFLSRALGVDPSRFHSTPTVPPEVQVRGSGDTTMVLIPCMSCRWSSWEPFMARNADRWKMYAVTLPGFGGTPVPDLPVDTNSAVWHDNAVDAVVRLVEEEGLRDVVLVGQSFGSAIALQVAARLPGRVKSLVNVDGGITSPRSWFPDSAAARPEAARALTEANERRYASAEAWRVFNAASQVPADREALYHGMFMATPRSVVFQYWRENLLRDPNPILQSLKIPVLDVKAIPADAQQPDQERASHLQMMRDAGAPATVRSVFLFNTGHYVHEQRPELLEESILRFLSGQEVADATPRPSAIALPGRFGHVEQRGEGEIPMILMPCLGCDWRAFDEFMERNARKFRMYAVTWPGMADTPMPGTPSPAPGTPLLDNIVAALERLISDEGLQRPVLVGHSAAGPVAIAFAAKHPKLLGGVITVDAQIQNNDTLGFTAAERARWADAEMAKVLRQYDDDQAWRKLNTVKPGSYRSPERDRMYEEMWRTPPRRHVLRYWREWVRLDTGILLPDIKVPVLALFAVRARDPDPARTRQTIVDQFERNNASASIAVEFIEPATHSIWEKAPDAFDAAIDRFVNSAIRKGDTSLRR